MLNDYMDKAMRHAQYRLLEDGTYFGSIPGFQGVWANAVTERERHQELCEVPEGWNMPDIANLGPLPVLPAI
jgi:hypothetical protein